MPETDVFIPCSALNDVINTQKYLLLIKMSRHCLDTVKPSDIYVSNCSFSRICNTMHSDSIIINKINRNLPVVKLYKIHPNFSWLADASSSGPRSRRVSAS